MTISVRMWGHDQARQTREVPSFLQGHSGSDALIAQSIHTLQQRIRVRRAHTKERAEVRGGGAKPWKQKGTGRSRHGSIRSPLWVGGGTTFGPRSRHQRVLPMPARMQQKALQSALISHLSAGTLEIVQLPAELPLRTKDVVAQLPDGDVRGLLMVVDVAHQGLIRAGRNIPGVRIMPVTQVKTMDIVQARRVWLDDAAISQLSARVVG